MILSIKIDLSPEREKWAYIAWQNVVAFKETEAASVEAFLSDTLKPAVEEFARTVTDSWKPEEDEAIKERRAAAAELLKEIPIEKLEAIEATLAAAEVEPNP